MLNKCYFFFSHIHLAVYEQLTDVTATQLCLAIADLYIQV